MAGMRKGGERLSLLYAQRERGNKVLEFPSGRGRERGRGPIDGGEGRYGEESTAIHSAISRECVAIAVGHTQLLPDQKRPCPNARGHRLVRLGHTTSWSSRTLTGCRHGLTSLILGPYQPPPGCERALSWPCRQRKMEYLPFFFFLFLFLCKENIYYYF